MTPTLSRRLLIASLSLLALGAQAQTALDSITKSKTIKIAIPTDYPPYGFVGPDMKPQGLDIAMAELIAAKLGVKVELVPVTSANRIPYLQTRKADLVISSLGKNPDREKVINFSAAYAPFFQAVFAAKSLTIKSWADLAGKSVAVTRGAMEDQELGKVAPATVSPKCATCDGMGWKSLGEGRGSVSCPGCNGRGTGKPIRTCTRHSDCRERPELDGVACALSRRSA